MQGFFQKNKFFLLLGHQESFEPFGEIRINRSNECEIRIVRLVYYLCAIFQRKVIQLADKMGCSQQYISKVLRGQENLSIETIAKIESALSIQILC